ncbi:unnamed protein product [Paramecium sonneborni]|uniref:Large ribosomal subunit protein uL18 C-terminal eukaryotes domain-containing protein n=1 Tax=Paramecium sonneborni TaxID=65129 RepID=A0A8S1LM27_9CILI|nr:unnamed protein product [Paramecium sonneborni]
MAFVKLVKGTPYFKRFQTKFRRRREGKTDYYARSRMITQDKDKYNSPKYRFVVRHTNTKIICQVIYATLKGDKVVAAAESTELKRFGLTSGLTNYAAAYATGLLLARRTLKSLKMDKFYEGNKTIDGTLYDVADKENPERRPFFAVLDIGLVRSTLGNRVFAALKGAADGGIHIPHNNRRFPGFVVDNDKKEKYDANVHKERIFGVHVDKYMALLQKEKKTNKDGRSKFDVQFHNWEQTLKTAGVKSVQELFKKIHDEIRKSSDRVKRAAKQNPKRDHTKFRAKRLNAKQRRANALKKIDIATKQAAKLKKKA